jgi:hypothetical protein
MKEIQLSQQGKNKGKYVALVDDSDYDYLMQWRWSVQLPRGNHIRVVRKDSKQNGGKILYMHRIIMNTPEGMEVDHIDHNGLNNQKSNLRNCTDRENKGNFIVRSVLGYKGVSKSGSKYTTNMTQNYKMVYLGIYKTIEEAARAYDKAAIAYFGEFAQLNFPKENYL